MECDHKHFHYNYKLITWTRLQSDPTPAHSAISLSKYGSSYYLLSSGFGPRFALRTHNIWCTIWKSVVPSLYSLASRIGALSITNWENRDVIDDTRFGLWRPLSTSLDWIERHHHIVLSPPPPENCSYQIPRLRSYFEATSRLLNFDIIRDWIRCYSSQHSRAISHHTQRPGSPALYMIDIRTRKVVLAPSGARYITLSYVRGTRTTYPGLN